MSSTSPARVSISLGAGDDLELVAQPLHRRAGDRDRALQRVHRAARRRTGSRRVVSRPFSERTISVPVFSSRKLPVP